MDKHIMKMPAVLTKPKEKKKKIHCDNVYEDMHTKKLRCFKYHNVLC